VKQDPQISFPPLVARTSKTFEISLVTEYHLLLSFEPHLLQLRCSIVEKRGNEVGEQGDLSSRPFSQFAIFQPILFLLLFRPFLSILFLLLFGNLVRTIGSSGSGDLQFINPGGMTIDGKERIFVAEDNHRIQCFDSQGSLLFKFDSKNQRILVADRKNHRIQAFDLKGTFLFTFGFVRKGKGEFKEPYGIPVR